MPIQVTAEPSSDEPGLYEATFVPRLTASPQRQIAERGRYPAINLLKSVSRSLPDAATPDENALIGHARRVLGAWDRAEMMVQAGLYTRGSDPAVDEAIRIFPRLDAFLAEAAPEGGVAASFDRLACILQGQG